MTIGSILKAAGNVFVEVDHQGEPAKSAPMPGVSARSAMSPSSRASSVSIDPEMLASLNKKIKDRKTPFTALLDSSDDLKSIIKDDRMRLQAAAKTTKATKSSINNAIDIHLSDIEGARIQFAKTSEQQISQKSGALRANAKSLDHDNADRTAAVEAKKLEITELEKDIAEAATTINELNSQADAAEADIKVTAQHFEQAVENVKQSLADQKSQLNAILS